nr:peptidase U32 family protein [uncultured Carboxylicivirga sp.]
MKDLKREDFEIMAPVGSYESLQAAIQGGADSVYFGIEQLNMRSRSSHNFSTEDLRKIVQIAKENGIKTYLTVNVVIFNEELDLMREIIDVAKEMEVTAIIASDQAAINYAHQKGVEVHISTQVNISNVETLKFYSHFADVVVLARELNMDQVKSIHQTIIDEDIRGPKGELIQIEMFAHGALCMATSGKCYISLHQLNSSANRGSCLQPCRRGYEVTEKETGKQMSLENEYIMSPKDLKTIHFMNKMIDAGVRVFKIEGRARSAEYVKNVCQCYSEAISAVLDGSYNDEKIQEWDAKLSEVFNRGFWDGYYLGQRLGEWSHNYGSKATKKKTYIGKGMNYFPKLGVAEFLMETQSLKVGDEVLITGPTTGVVQMKVSELRVDLESVEETKKGERFSMPVDMKIRRSDKLYKLTETLNNQ